MGKLGSRMLGGRSGPYTLYVEDMGMWSGIRTSDHVVRLVVEMCR
jgi:hypothetical protein